MHRQHIILSAAERDFLFERARVEDRSISAVIRQLLRAERARYSRSVRARYSRAADDGDGQHLAGVSSN